MCRRGDPLRLRTVRRHTNGVLLLWFFVRCCCGSRDHVGPVVFTGAASMLPARSAAPYRGDWPNIGADTPKGRVYLMKSKI